MTFPEKVEFSIMLLGLALMGVMLFDILLCGQAKDKIRRSKSPQKEEKIQMNRDDSTKPEPRQDHQV